MKNHLRSIIALVMLLCLCCTLLVGCGAKEEAAPAPAEETQEAAAVQEPAEPAPEVTEEPAAEPEEEPAQEPVEEEGVVEIVAEANPSPDPNHKHTYKTWVDYPTCLHGGATYHKCTECGFMWFENIKGALGHEWRRITFSEATCTTDGQFRDTCARCGAIKFEKNPDQPAHNKSTRTVAATCTDGGYTEITCDVCNKVLQTINKTSPLGHEFTQTPGKCSRCGAQDPNYVPGQTIVPGTPSDDSAKTDTITPSGDSTKTDTNTPTVNTPATSTDSTTNVGNQTEPANP